jgi:hypothetical protein
LKDHAVGTLDLAIAPRVGNQGVVDVGCVVLAKIPKGGPWEIGDDSVGHTEAVCDLLHEFCRFF